MKKKIKDLWFDAEGKAVEYGKLEFFKFLSKLVHTAAMLILCVIIFTVYCLNEFFLYVKEKLQRKQDVEELDEYSAREETILPDKVEPGEIDKVDRVRKWM